LNEAKNTLKTTSGNSGALRDEGKIKDAQDRIKQKSNYDQERMGREEFFRLIYGPSTLEYWMNVGASTGGIIVLFGAVKLYDKYVRKRDGLDEPGETRG